MYHYEPRKLLKNTQEPCAQDSILLIGQLGFVISLNPHQQHSSSHPTHSHSCFCGVENWCFEIRSEFLFSTTQECQKTCSKFKDVDSSNFRNTPNSHKCDLVLRNFQDIIIIDGLLPGQCWPPHCNSWTSLELERDKVSVLNVEEDSLSWWLKQPTGHCPNLRTGETARRGRWQQSRVASCTRAAVPSSAAAACELYWRN